MCEGVGECAAESQFRPAWGLTLGMSTRVEGSASPLAIGPEASFLGSVLLFLSLCGRQPTGWLVVCGDAASGWVPEPPAPPLSIEC